MTIAGWILIIFIWLIIIGTSVAVIVCNTEKAWVIVLAAILALALCVGIYMAGRWYFTSTASGIRALNDQRSELQNGLDRTITIYTATGEKLVEYKGKIDLEMDQDYIKFDWNGKRYIYYNCFVETVADISQ